MKEQIRTKAKCLYCNKDFFTQTSRVKKGWDKYCSKSCASHSRTRERHPRWNGGKIKTGLKGYISCLCPEHPFATKQGYVPEHRLVMEAHLGRHLLPTETVHHINGKVFDNRIENLMLFSSRGEHTSFHFKLKANKREKDGF